MASSTDSRSSGSPSRDDASPGPSPEHTTASSPNNNPVRAGQTVTLLFPLPKVLRCTEDDCRHSYAPINWTSRVQSLLRHLEQDHGFQQLDKIYRCTRCDTVLTSRPTTHACLRGGAVEETASPARYRCDRCSASFPSSRGLVNHRLWHRDRDARVATRRTTTTTRRPPRLTSVPTSSPDASSDRRERVDANTTPAATASNDLSSPPNEVVESPPDTPPVTSPPASPSPPTAAPLQPVHHGPAASQDARAGVDRSQTSLIAETQPDLLGDLTTTLRHLLAEAPTATAWRTCEDYEVMRDGSDLGGVMDGVAASAAAAGLFGRSAAMVAGSVDGGGTVVYLAQPIFAMLEVPC
ncbi:hypothetical protein HPB50_022788 [Hyalomma asiaticum]|uniref:Uncharacterized protein n=1 Tax=Hyalomma asiaticum TaxID=266040 RepID=A0ACB7TDQ9_HYAAI|nr:hypothetical protein HPB50_022788 [Hyalomma asiaticum]